MPILMNSCFFNAKQSTKLSTRGHFGKLGKKGFLPQKSLKFTSLFIVNSSVCYRLD